MGKEQLKPHEVSAYNHKPIGTPEKPLISNEDFKTIMEHVRKGFYNFYEEAKQHKTFEDRQKKMIEDIIYNRII